MDLTTIVADAVAVLNVGKIAVQVGEDAAPFVKAAYSILTGGGTLTDTQRAALLAQEESLRAQLDAADLPADST